MPLPEGVESVTLNGGANGLTNPDGTAAAGTVTLTPSVERVTSSVHGLIVLGPANATLSASGTFTLGPVLATDADDFSPSGWTYRVDENLTGRPPRSYSISLPAAAPVVALPDVAPVSASVGTVVSPSVLSVNGESGTVVLDAVDVGAVPTSRQVVAGAGLSGGGSLAADRTLSVAFGTSGSTVCVGNDARLSDARTPLAHAASHASAGSDPITVAQSQVTGLTAALAAKAAGPASSTGNAVARYDGTTGVLLKDSAVTIDDSGGIVAAGALTVGGYTTLQGGQFNSDFAAFGNMTLIGTGKSVRFRRDGDGVDVEGSGAATVVSVWSGAGFTGSQRTYLRLEADQQLVQAVGPWRFVDSPFGGGHTLTGSTIGFFGATAVGKPTVSGSWADGSAGASLAAALETLGLIVDNTTA